MNFFSLADEAFQLAKEKKFKEAYAKMEQAETEGILKAHQAQTLVIQDVYKRQFRS